MACNNGWSKPRLEFVGDNQEPVLLSLERPDRLRFRKSIHVRLGVGCTAIRNRAGERDQCLERVPLFGQIFVHRQLVAHGVQARASDDHGLGLPVDLFLHPLGEVLHHDAHFLADSMGMKFDKGFQQIGGFLLVVTRIVFDLLPEPPVGFMCCVVLKNIENEPPPRSPGAYCKAETARMNRFHVLSRKAPGSSASVSR